MSQKHWSNYNSSKEALRQKIWERLRKTNAVNYDPRGHIPNFLGAEEAATQLRNLDIWQTARVIKCNPDKPQAPVRAAALADGKILYMAVPRLVNEYCFVELRREQVLAAGLSWQEASQKKTILELGRPVSFSEMQPLDLAIVGCVAASRAGGRTGKGAGFADLELAMLKHFGLIKKNMAIATTIHPEQLVSPEHLPLEAHDWSLDWICTTTEAIATNHNHPQPQGLDWQNIKPQQWQSIPILKSLRQKSSLNH